MPTGTCNPSLRCQLHFSGYLPFRLVLFSRKFHNNYKFIARLKGAVVLVATTIKPADRH